MNVYGLSNNLQIHLHCHVQISGLHNMVKVGSCLKAALAPMHFDDTMSLRFMMNEVDECVQLVV